MPKNMGKGGKSFKAGNAKANPQKRDITYADPNEGEEYAMVKKALGNLKLELQLTDGSKVIGVVRGAMVRKVWVTIGDIVIISRREFNYNDKVDIIHKFQPQEVRHLIKDEIIPRDFRSQEEIERGRANNDYELVAELDDEEEEEDGNAIDRNQVQLIDPLAELDDL